MPDETSEAPSDELSETGADAPIPTSITLALLQGAPIPPRQRYQRRYGMIPFALPSGEIRARRRPYAHDCPACGCLRSHHIHTQRSADHVDRQRRCHDCGAHFTLRTMLIGAYAALGKAAAKPRKSSAAQPSAAQPIAEPSAEPVIAERTSL